MLTLAPSLEAPRPSESQISSRLGIAFFYDDLGIVDEYFFYLLEEVRKFTTRNICISNGPLEDSAITRLKAMGFEVLIRENVGFDVWAYKTALEHVGYENFSEFDEILLFNHTFYGPIYPFEEMFGAMDSRECGFWGITAHKELVPNPFTGTGTLPRHLNSHFIAVRKELFLSAEFEEYWQNMPMITSYTDSRIEIYKAF
jgi:lipopolysaccharide biosynthesis protein